MAPPTSPQPAPPPSPRTRPALNASAILDAALAVVGREGAEALTFRRLGRELGAAPTAVLRHFRDKDDLLRALGERLLAQSVQELPVDEPDWRVRLRRVAESTQQVFLTHPRVAILVATRTMRREAEFRGADYVIRAMLDAGLSAPEAASLYRAFIDTVLAWAAFQAAAETVDDDAMARDEASWSREYLLLPAAGYPAIHAVAPHLARANDEDQFAVAIELLLEAVEARARRTAGSL